MKEELPRIGVDAFALLMAIASHLGYTNDQAWPGQKKLRQMCPVMNGKGELKPMSRERFYMAIGWLIEKKMVRRWQVNKNGTFGGTRYRITTEYLGIYSKASLFTLTDPEDGAEDYEAGYRENVHPETGEPYNGKPYNGKPYNGFPSNATASNGNAEYANPSHLNSYQGEGVNHIKEVNQMEGAQSQEKKGQLNGPENAPPQVPAAPPQPIREPMARNYMEAAPLFWKWAKENAFIPRVLGSLEKPMSEEIAEKECRLYFANLEHKERFNLIWWPTVMPNVAGLENWLTRAQRWGRVEAEKENERGNVEHGLYDESGNYLGKTENVA